jgi:hypothetical protein
MCTIKNRFRILASLLKRLRWRLELNNSLTRSTMGDVFCEWTQESLSGTAAVGHFYPPAK